MKTCPTCAGKKKVNKKAWGHVDMSALVRDGVHPAIACSAPAFRTIVQVTCETCHGRGEVP